MASSLLMASAIQSVLGVLLLLTAVFLILIVLVQRGRGGGLAGALGGMGGQSAFGTKAGDTFTRVTIVTASIWILLCIASVKLLSSQPGRFGLPEEGIGSALPVSEEKLPGTDASGDSEGTGSAPAKGSDQPAEKVPSGGASGDGAAQDPPGDED